MDLRHPVPSRLVRARANLDFEDDEKKVVGALVEF